MSEVRMLIEITAIVAVETDEPTLAEVELLTGTGLMVSMGEVEYSQIGVTRIVVPLDGQCDFCNDPSPVWRYPADDFSMGMVIPGIEEASQGGWLACAVCSDFIELDKYPDLEDRALKATGIRSREAREMLTSMYQGFRGARSGPREALTE